MQKTVNVDLLKKTMLLAIVLSSVFFVASATIASAEEVVSVETTSEVVATETKDSEEVAAKKAAMKAQIESLRKVIEEHKAQLKAKQETEKVERKEALSEWKGTQAEARAAFLASLEGLSPEEKKVAILAYIAELKAAIEAKKTEVKTEKAEIKEAVKERKEMRIEDQEAFRASLEGKSAQEKYDAIMTRVAEIKAALAARLAEGDDDSDTEEEDEEENEEEDENEDENEDEDEEEDEDESTS